MGIVVALLLMLATDWSTVVKPLSKQVVRLEMQHGEDVGTCSGSVIDATRGYILTAAHCIPNGLPDSFALTANRRDAQLVKINRILDLAILHFDVKGEQEISLAVETPESGSEIMVLGFGFGVKQAAPQFGRITLQRSDEGDRVWIDAATLQGDSGGPVVDALGRQVAVNSLILYNGPAHISAAVRVEDIRDFVKGFVGTK